MNTRRKACFRHFIIEVNDCNPVEINSVSWLQSRMGNLLGKLKIKPLKVINHQFQPQGVSLVCILSASHISFHTWPEFKYLHIDLITCREDNHVDTLRQIVNEVFMTHNFKIIELNY